MLDETTTPRYDARGRGLFATRDGDLDRENARLLPLIDVIYVYYYTMPPVPNG